MITTVLLVCLAACAPIDDSGKDTAAQPASGADTDGFEALAGLTFVQTAGPGVASYTFQAEDDIYIDYTAAPDEWELDDGTPLPDHKGFIDVGYDGVRTFHGGVDWSVPEATTAGGDERWIYTMEFDEGYTEIADGIMEAYNSKGELTYILTFGEDLIYTRYE